MQLPIGLAIVRGSSVLLVGIGLMVVVFASREVDPWPRAKVGSAIWPRSSASSCSSDWRSFKGAEHRSGSYRVGGKVTMSHARLG